MIIQEAVNTVVQLSVVLIIAGLAWLIFARKRAGFRAWLGLTAPTGRSMALALGVFAAWSAVTAVIYFMPAFVALAASEGTVAGRIRAEGFSLEVIALIVILAVFKTGLTEEIFFRGLIGKRLINLAGFWTGNTLQAALFGAVHLLIFVVPGGPAFTPLLGALIFVLPGVASWLMGFANEKLGNGSIAPGWLIHGLGNAIGYPILAFAVG
jgi:membrane protease YdiL (CAAX protease family)